jgi:hypothetical protein
MRAMAIREFGGSDRIELMDLPEPKVGPDTVRIAVKAAGLNPVDCKVREGNLEAAFPHHFPLILGWDAAGTVEAVGPAVVGLQEGDEVYAYCRKTEICEGTYAELVSMPAGAVARKPRAASWAQAGGTPLAGLTAWQVLVEALAAMLPSAEFGVYLEGKNCATHSLHFSLIKTVTKAMDPADGFQSLRSQTYFIAGPLCVRCHRIRTYKPKIKLLKYEKTYIHIDLSNSPLHYCSHYFCSNNA